MDCMSMHQGGCADQYVNPKNIFIKTYVQSSQDFALIQTTGGVTSGCCAPTSDEFLIPCNRNKRFAATPPPADRLFCLGTEGTSNRCFDG